MDIEDEGNAGYIESNDIEEEAQEAVVQGKDLKDIEQIQKKNPHLCRSPVDPLFSTKDPLIFMQIDVNNYKGEKCEANQSVLLFTRKIFMINK